MDDEDLVLARELYDLLEEALGRDRARRVVRVVDEHQARPCEVAGRELLEIGREATLRLERQQDGFRAGEQRPAGIDGITGVGYERDVARVQEGKAEVVEALLGADRGDHLRSRVDLDVEAAAVEAGQGCPELLTPPVRRVVVRAGIGHGGLHGLDHVGEGRVVGVADSEVDHVDPGGALFRHLLLELGELVRRDRLEALGGIGESHRAGQAIDACP